MTKTKKTAPKAEKKQPNLKIVPKPEPTAADKMMSEQLKGQLKKAKVKEKPTEQSLASQAMEYSDQALAYAEFTRKMRNNEQVDGGLVSSALRYAMAEAAQDAGRKVETLSPEVRSAERERLMMDTHPFADLYRGAVKQVNELRSR